MTDAEVLAAIQANHLKANISDYEVVQVWEGGRQSAVIHWERAWIDPGGTIFGRGPYAKVPITLHFDPPFHGSAEDEIVIRVYPPERLRKRLALKWRPASPQEDTDG